MKFGLENEIYNKIKKVLNLFPYKFLIFGSRARGDFKKESDIDLAVLEFVEDKDKLKILNELDKLDIIYMIDIIFAFDCKKQGIVESVKKEGIEF